MPLVAYPFLSSLFLVRTNKTKIPDRSKPPFILIDMTNPIDVEAVSAATEARSEVAGQDAVS
jgi:hypothetical protein